MRVSTPSTTPEPQLAADLREFHDVLTRFVPPQVAWVVSAIALVTFVLSAWRIFSKTGYHGSLGILMVVPGVNVLLVLVLAFSRWPIEKELRARRKGRI